MTGSGISKLEAGGRAGLSLADLAALSITLNVPTTAFVLVPDPADPHAWSPKTLPRNRSWAENVTWVQVADDVVVHRSQMDRWLGGAPVARTAVAWLGNTHAELDQFMSASPPAQRIWHAIFRHPALTALAALESAVTEVLAGGAGPERRDTIGVDREMMAAHLRDNAERLAKYIDLLAEDVVEDRTPGRYLTEAELSGAVDG